MKGNTKTLLGFLAGIAVGAGVYAFLQSKQGKAFAQKMKDKANDVKEDLADLGEKARRSMQNEDDIQPQSE